MKTLLVFSVFWGAVWTSLAQPVIVSQPRDQAKALEASASFSVSASGTAPLSYQWRREAVDLAGATNSSLVIFPLQLTSAGGYTVVVTNTAGAVTSQVAQLSVAQGRYYTNAQGGRLPYRLFAPPDYDPGVQYPMVLFWHGAGEGGTDNLGQLLDQGQYVFLSATNVARHPCFLLAPQTLSSGSCDYFYGVQDMAIAILDLLGAEFSIDVDRVYVTGLSLGGMGSWTMAARYPDRIAAAVPMSGNWPCPAMNSQYLALRLPIWNFHAANDTVVAVSGSDNAITSLRNAGGNPIYTRYQSGGHGIWPQAYYTPGLVDWVMAQRRGLPSTFEPLLSINSPTGEAVCTPDAATEALDLAGSAGALGQPVARVDWTNTAARIGGMASGSNLWSVIGMPKAPPATNLIIVTASTTSGSAAYGGVTTFNDTLTVLWQFDRPFITAQPTNQAVRAGTTASLRVTAYSLLPLSYQWQFEAQAIEGATNTSLSLSNVQATHAGTYAVVVTDSRGSVTSAPAVLTVVFDPVIVQQPCDVSVPQGGSVTLSVAVTNNATLPIGYRWRRGTSTLTNVILNERVCFLTLTNCQVTTNYQVVITTAGLSRNSSRVWVTVLADADQDGMPDEWEAAYGLSPTNDQHRALDSDGDGLLDWQEYEAGTDPTNALSLLKMEAINLAEGSGTPVLRFLAVSNHTYTVQFRETLATGDWLRLADVAAAPTNRLVELGDPAAAASPRRFYRVRTPQTP